MTTTYKNLIWALLFAAIMLWTGISLTRVPAPTTAEVHAAASSDSSKEEALFRVTTIFSSIEGCRGRFDTARLTAKHALRTGLPASLVAAKIAVESRCDPLAVSSKGAVGLTQVVPRVWGRDYNFSHINLFNEDTNIMVGTDIMADYVKRYGLRDGVRRYNGSGPEAEAYAVKVLTMAGLK